MAAPRSHAFERPWLLLPLLLWTFLWQPAPVNAAPYLPNGFAQQTQAHTPLDFVSPIKGGMIGPLFRPNDQTAVELHPAGCYYQFHHYEEGDRIITNEPCLNCTCHNSMLMCYLKVCPFSKPIGLDCTIEKSPDQCCPVIICPQVPVNLQVMHMTTTTTVSPEMEMMGIVPYVEHGCTMPEGDYYPDGAQVPGDPAKPCELCYCIRNHTACIMQECILKVEGCVPVFQESICCPVRYQCEEGDHPIFPQIGANDPYATVVYQSTDRPSSPQTSSIPATTSTIPSKSPAQADSPQTDEPPEARTGLELVLNDLIQFLTGTGGRRSKVAHDEEDTFLTTTLSPSTAPINATTGLPTTTMIPGGVAGGCTHLGEFYADGASITTEDPCEHCYCMKGDLVCAIHDCKSSLDEDDEGCVPQPPLPGQCCPQAYDCPDQPETTTLISGVTSTMTETTASPTSATMPDETEEGVEEVTIKESGSMTSVAAGEDSTASTDPIEEEQTITTERPSELIDTSVQYGLETSAEPGDEDLRTRITIGETFQTDPSDEETPVDRATVAIEDLETRTDAGTLDAEKTTPMVSEMATTVQDIDTATESSADQEDSLSTGTESSVVASTPSTAIPGVTVSSGDETDATSPETLPEEGVTPTTAEETSPEDLTETPVDTQESTVAPDDVDATTAAPSEETDPAEEIQPSTDAPESEISAGSEPTATEASSVPSTEVAEGASPSPDVETDTTEGVSLPDGVTDTTEELPAPDTVTDTPAVSSPADVTESPDDVSSIDAATDTPAEVSATGAETDTTEEVPSPDTVTETPEDIQSPDAVTDSEAISSATDEPEVIDATSSTEPSVEDVEDGISTSTSSSIVPAMTEMTPGITGIPGEGECMINETNYQSGEDIPTSSVCEESCMCRDSVVVCKFKPCPAAPPAFLRCTPSELPGECCPSYDCPALETNTTCVKNGVSYEDGVTVPSADICTDCFCVDGDIICAELECRPPSAGCVATRLSIDSCCPVEYECPPTAPESASQVTSTDEPATDGDLGKVEPSTDSGDLAQTESPAATTDPAGCSSNGVLYGEGDIVPSASPCQVNCTCLSGEVQCRQQACPPAPPAFLRCVDVGDPMDCCPAFACPPTPVGSEATCQYGGQTFQDGERVPTFDVCEDCYCMESDIVCAQQECVAPEGNCVPAEVSEGNCCPTSYDCTDVTAPEISASPQFTVDFTDEATPSPTSETEGATPEDEFVGTSAITKDATDSLSLPDSTATTEDASVTDATDAEVDPIPETTSARPDTETTLSDDQVTLTEGEPSTDSKPVSEADVVTEVPGIEETGVTEEITSTYSVDDETVTDTEVAIDSQTPTDESTEPSIVDETSGADISEVTDSLADTVTEATIDGSTESSVGDATETPVDDATETSVDDATETSVDEATETSVDDATETSVDDATETSVGDATETSVDDATELSVDDATETSVDDATETSVDDGTETSVDDATETSVDDATETSMGDATESSISASTDASVGETAGVVIDETTEPSIDTITDGPSVETTESYGDRVTDASPDASTDPAIDETTEPSVSDGTEPAGEVETESSATDLDTTEPTITADIYPTESSVGPGDIVPIDEGTCEKNGKIYADGDRVQRENRCQDRCVCRNSVIECEMFSCPPAPPAVLRCSPVEAEGQCCPSYECENISPGGPENLSCQKDGVEFANGQYVPSPTICTDCYCIDGEVVCATVECHVPAGNCTGLAIAEGSCCPEKYVCTPAEGKTEPPAPTPEVGDSVTAAPVSDTTAPGSDTTTSVSDTTASISDTTGPVSDTTAPVSDTTGPISDTTGPVSDTTAPVSDTTGPISDTTGPVSDTTAPVSDSTGQSCSRDGVVYDDGQSVPVSSPCQEGCSCSNAMVQCSLLACPPAPPAFLRCTPQEQTDQCCPVYDCPSGTPDTTEAPGCEQNGLQFSDGELVPSSDQCQDCYCLEGEVVCATLECQPPAGQDCVPLEFPEGSCCPTQYQCNDFIPTFGLETSDGPDSTFSVIDETTGPSTDPTDAHAMTGATEAPESETSTTSAMDEVTEGGGEETTDATAIGSAEVTSVSTDDAVEGVTETPTTMPPMEEGDCLRDQVYSNGSSVPPASPCEESCVCLDGSVQCELQACPPPPPAFLRCSPIEQPETCCPSYDCPTVGPDAPSCEMNGTIFAEGEYVPSQSYCTDCYCVSGEVVCASIDCEAPGENCLPIEIPEGSCCPTRYSCSDAPPTLSPGDSTFFTDGLSTRQTIPGAEDSDSTPTLPEGEPAAPTDTTDVPDSTTLAPVSDAETTVAPDAMTIDAATDSDVTDADEATLPESGTEASTSGDVSTDLPVEESSDTSTDKGIDSTVTDAPATDELSESTSSPIETDASMPESTEPTDQAETTDGAQPSESSTAAPSEGDETVPESTEPTDQAQTTDGSEPSESSTAAPSEGDETVPESTEPTDQAQTTDGAQPSESSTTAPSEGDETVPESTEPTDQAQTTDGSEPSESSTAAPSEGDETVPESTEPTDQTETTEGEEILETTVVPSEVEMPDDATDSTVDVSDPDGVTEITPETIEGMETTESDADTVTEVTESDIPGETTEAGVDTATDAVGVDATTSLPDTETDGPSTDTIDTSTDSATEPSTGSDCILNDYVFRDGDYVPSRTECQDSCLCINGTIQCEQIACAPAPPAFFRCTQTQTDTCCPSYDCVLPTAPSTNGSSSATCQENGMTYSEGQFIPSETLCTDCYCIDGEKVCATIECTKPGSNCVVSERLADSCCPTKYMCDESATETTEMPIASVGDCVVDGNVYADGAHIPKSDPCQDCFCFEGETVCSEIECVYPGENCTVLERSDLQCCPTAYECDGIPMTTTFGGPPTTVEVKFTETPYGETLETRDTDQPTESTSDGLEGETSATEATAELTTVDPSEVETTEDSISSQPDVTITPVDEQTTGEVETTPQPEEVSESDLTDVTEGDVTTSQPEDVTEADVSDTTDEIAASTEPEDTVDVTEEISTASEGPEPSASTSPDVIDDQTTDSPQTVTEATAVPVTESDSDDTTESSVDLSEPSTDGPVEETTETIEGVTDDSSSTDSSIYAEATTPSSAEEDVTETTSDSISETTVSVLDCVVDGKTYTMGETIPSPSDCQANCTCAEGKLQCQVVACPPAPPAFLRCVTIKEESSGCCPTYECPTAPNPEMLPMCTQDGQQFMDGDSVPSADVCSDCFCIEGEVVCATLECSAPGPRCTPAQVPEGVCCPASYDCVEDLDAMPTPSPGEDDSEVTTASPAETDQSTCFRSGGAYSSGETVPTQSSCEESCTCTGGEVMCVALKCPDKPPAFLRCTAQRSSPDECCPSYVCPDESTTEAPGCQQDGVFYNHGQYVNSSNICTDCYCVDGEIVCATLECQAPMPRCTAASTSPQECCPTSYVCPEDSGTEETTGATTESSEDATESPTEGVEDSVAGATEDPMGTDDISSTDEPVTGAEVETTESSDIESPEVSSVTQEPSTIIEDVDFTDGPITDGTISETGASSTDPSVTEGDDTTTEESVSEIDPSSTEPSVTAGDETTSEDSVSATDPSSTEPSVSPGDETTSEDTVSEIDPSSTEPSVTVGDETTSEDTVSDIDPSSTEPSVITEDETTSEDSVSETDPSSTEPSVTTGDETTSEDTVSEIDPSSTEPSVTVGDETTSEDTVSEIDPSSTEPSVTVGNETTSEDSVSETDSSSTEPTVITDEELSSEAPIDDVMGVATEETPGASPESGDQTEDDYTPGLVTESSQADTTGDVDSTVPETIETIKSTDGLDDSTDSPIDDVTATSSPVDIESEITTEPEEDREEPEPTTPAYEMDDNPCKVNNSEYNDGDAVPSLGPCQHSCKCVNGTVKCERQSCPPNPPQFLRCSPVPEYSEDDQCCPVYSCPPAAGSQVLGTSNCTKDGQEYEDGAYVPSPTQCTDCYCIDGVIVCAELDCGVPGPNCEPVYQQPGSCCPSTYECQETAPGYPTGAPIDPLVPGRVTYTQADLETTVTIDEHKETDAPAEVTDEVTAATPSETEVTEETDESTATSGAPQQPSTSPAKPESGEPSPTPSTTRPSSPGATGTIGDSTPSSTVGSEYEESTTDSSVGSTDDTSSDVTSIDDVISTRITSPEASPEDESETTASDTKEGEYDETTESTQPSSPSTMDKTTVAQVVSSSVSTESSISETDTTMQDDLPSTPEVVDESESQTTTERGQPDITKTTQGEITSSDDDLPTSGGALTTVTQPEDKITDSSASVTTESSISGFTMQEDLSSTPEVAEQTGSQTTERGQLEMTKTTPSETTSSDDDAPTSGEEITTVSRPIILPGISVTEKLPQPDDKITDSPSDTTESTVDDTVVDLTVKTSDVTDSPSTATEGLESSTDESEVSEITTESVDELAESTDTTEPESSEPTKTSSTPHIPEFTSSYGPTITAGDLVTEETLSTRNESSEATQTTAKPTGSTQGITMTDSSATQTTTGDSQTTPLDIKYPTSLSSTFEDSESTVADDYVTETTIVEDASKIPSVVTESTVQSTSPSTAIPTSADSVTDEASTQTKPTPDVTDVHDSKQTTLDDLSVTTESTEIAIDETSDKTSTVSDVRETSEPEATNTTLATSDKPLITQTTPAAPTTVDEIDVTNELFSTRITSPDFSPEEENETDATSSPTKPASDVTVVDESMQTTLDESSLTTESSMVAEDETSTSVSDVRETSDPSTTDEMLTGTTLSTSAKPLVSQTTPAVPTTADDTDVTDEFISTRITSPEISTEEEKETDATSSPTKPTSDVTVVDESVQTTSDDSSVTTESSIMVSVDETSTKTSTTVSDEQETSDPQATDEMLTDTTLSTSAKPLVSQTTPAVPTTADDTDVTDEFISTRITSPEISTEEKKETDATSSPTKPTSDVTVVDEFIQTTSDESSVTTESSMVTEYETSTNTTTTVSDERETSDPQATDEMLTDTTLSTSAKPLVSQTTPAVPTTADDTDVTDELFSTTITPPEISPEEEKETDATSSPTKPTSDVTVVDESIQTTSDESRVTTESSMVAVDATSTTDSDVRETSDPHATDGVMTDTTLVTSAKPLVSQTTPAVPTTADETDVTDEFVSTRFTSPEEGPETDSISPETVPDVLISATSPKPTIGVGELVTEEPSKPSSVDGETITSLPTASIPDESTVTTKQPSTVDIASSTVSSLITSSQAETVDSSSPTYVETDTTDGVKFPTSAVTSSSPAPAISTIGDQTTENVTSEATAVTSHEPSSVASTVPEPSTTSPSTPPPLYQTPKPETAVTGYTSAFPPFPGGMFPSTTTWKPSTTPDYVLGPGACMFDGKVYVSAQQILRDDPCDFCFCFRGDIICLQQSCPPPVPGCFEEPIPGFCCPRYECPLTKTVVNITTTTTPIPTYPPLQRSEEIIMCEIGDKYYHQGETVEEASGPCLQCRCGNDGMMECDPKECPASPMLGKIFRKGSSLGYQT